MLTKELVGKVWAKTMTKILIVSEHELEAYNFLDNDKYLSLVDSGDYIKTYAYLIKISKEATSEVFSVEDILFCDSIKYFGVFFEEIRSTILNIKGEHRNETEDEFNARILNELLSDYWTCVYDLAQQSLISANLVEEEDVEPEYPASLIKAADSILTGKKMVQPNSIKPLIEFSRTLMTRYFENLFDWIELTEDSPEHDESIGDGFIDHILRFGTIFFPLCMITNVMLEFKKVFQEKEGLLLDYDWESIDFLDEQINKIAKHRYDTDERFEKYWEKIDE